MTNALLICKFARFLDTNFNTKTYVKRHSNKKGLDIKLVGGAALNKTTAIKSNFYTIRPEDFHGVTPKLLVKVGQKIKAGEAVFFDKSNEDIKFVSLSLEK